MLGVLQAWACVHMGREHLFCPDGTHVYTRVGSVLGMYSAHVVQGPTALISLLWWMVTRSCELKPFPPKLLLVGEFYHSNRRKASGMGFLSQFI